MMARANVYPLKTYPKPLTVDENRILKSNYIFHLQAGDGSFPDVITIPLQDLLQWDSVRGWTALHWAAFYGQAEVLNTMINLGLNINTWTRKGAETPLHLASLSGSEQCVHLLLNSGAAINIQDARGETALHKAILHQRQHIAVFLKAFGIDQSIVDKNGKRAEEYSPNYVHHPNFQRVFREMKPAQAPYRMDTEPATATKRAPASDDSHSAKRSREDELMY